MRRRYIDYGAFMVRHNDGLKDLVAKLIGKCREMVDRFKSLPTGRKIAYILGRIAQVAGAIFSAKEGRKLYTDIKILKKLNTTLKEQVNDEEQLDKFGTQAGKAIVFGGLKVISGLVAAIIGTVTETYAMNK